MFVGFSWNKIMAQKLGLTYFFFCSEMQQTIFFNFFHPLQMTFEIKPCL
jgi:hypothetical protein